ncbi:MAG: methylated-DNA--[protein]-cysteine S-methyltransferase [Lachnospiraceae bacterium]|nr:methylated-DNA--[protein]-cysteine S-methyltransferase [Lachnospiraceae bacterium]
MSGKLLNRTWIETPIGRIKIEEDGEAITSLYLVKEASQESKDAREGAQAISGIVDTTQQESSLLQEAKKQLQEYFAGERKVFDLPVKPQGTPFQQKVWSALRTIPYGETCSYGEIAAKIGNPKAARAVGGANNKNPILIVIPCHRVIGANGAMVGFGCGLPVKEYLLLLEKKHHIL